MEARIGISVNLFVKDKDALKREIADLYECDVENIDRDYILEYISEHIIAKNTCNDLFVIEGAETDGGLIQSMECVNF